MKASLGLVIGIVLGVLAGSAGAWADEAAAKPKRIVSLNMCLDELTLALADRDAIASVTWLSRDKLNGNMAKAAELVPVNNGSAEEVLPPIPISSWSGRSRRRRRGRCSPMSVRRCANSACPKRWPKCARKSAKSPTSSANPRAAKRWSPISTASGARLRRSQGAEVARDHPPAERFHGRPGSLVDELLERAGSRTWRRGSI